MTIAWFGGRFFGMAKMTKTTMLQRSIVHCIILQRSIVQRSIVQCSNTKQSLAQGCKQSAKKSLMGG